MLSNNLSRRDFIGKAGLGKAGVAVVPGYILSDQKSFDRKIRIGIVGGRFGTSFQFHEHPGCIVEAVSDLRPERQDRLMKLNKRLTHQIK